MSRYDPFTLAEGTPFNSQLGYPAYAVIIDNITASWIHSLEGGRSIPPFTYGAVVPLPGTQAPRMTWETPPAITPNPAGVGQAQLIFTDAALPAQNGSNVFTQGAIASDLGLVTAHNGTTTQAVPLPSGTTVIGVFPEPNNGALTLTITGNVTGIDYFNAVTNLGVAAQFASIDPLDTALNVIASAGATAASVRVVAYPFTPLGVESGAVLTVTPSQSPLPVTVQSGTGTLLRVATTVALAPGATSVLLAAVAGQTTTLYGYTLSFHTAAGIVAGADTLALQDTVPTNIDVLGATFSTASGEFVVAPKCLWLPPGLSLGQNVGIRLLALGGNAHTITADVAVFYTQQ